MLAKIMCWILGHKKPEFIRYNPTYRVDFGRGVSVPNPPWEWDCERCHKTIRESGNPLIIPIEIDSRYSRSLDTIRKLR